VISLFVGEIIEVAEVGIKGVENEVASVDIGTKDFTAKGYSY